MNNTVEALVPFDDGSGSSLLCAGGWFTEADGATANRVACWDGSSWMPMGSGFDDNGVNALAVYDDGVTGPSLYAGGSFTTSGGVAVKGIARWTGFSWVEVGGGTNAFVGALTVVDDGGTPALIVGGAFLYAGGIPAPRLAKWDGVRWSPLTQSMNERVWALLESDLLDPPGLYVGGTFTTVDGIVSDRIGLRACTCNFSTNIQQDQWQMIGLPCSPYEGTVDGVFGDNLPPADYDSTWAMYEWDAASGQYTHLGLDSALTQGPGYWIKTLEAGQSIDVDGWPTRTSCPATSVFAFLGCYGISLTGTADGRYNMIGHPMAYAVNWGDVRFVDDSGNEWTPSGAEAQGVASKTMYTWNGSAYQAWDDVTPGMLGTLGVFEGQWVKAFATATALRIPALPASGSLLVPARASGEGEWLIRLTASSGAHSDPGNVFGRLKGSTEGLDSHDLEERAPFDSDYLTVVFPHPEWHTGAWAYTSDFRGLEDGTSGSRLRTGPMPPQPMGEVWRFEVRAGQAGRKVVLRWQGPADILRRSQLVDLTTGKEIVPEPGGKLTFEMDGTVRRFTWVVAPEETGEGTRR